MFFYLAGRVKNIFSVGPLCPPCTITDPTFYFARTLTTGLKCWRATPAWRGRELLGRVSGGREHFVQLKGDCPPWRPSLRQQLRRQSASRQILFLRMKTSKQELEASGKFGSYKISPGICKELLHFLRILPEMTHGLSSDDSKLACSK